MVQGEAVPGLRERWSALRGELVFLPRLDQMTVERHDCGLEAVEFVRVAPSDQEVMLPEASHVSSADVRDFPGWSEVEEDQLQMWSLVGTVIEGNRVTRPCPDCRGSKQLTCSHCGGAGWVTCSWCHGSGAQFCTSCGGSGWRSVTRTTTDADGTTSTRTESETCTSCGGRGRTMCLPCMGTGQDSCSHCGGTGEVTCDTCSPRGTVDLFLRRNFAALSVKTHILPARLPGYPAPVQLSPAYVQIAPPEQAVPCDAVAEQGKLAARGLTGAEARLFFIRRASASVHLVSDPQTGQLVASFIEGKKEPIFTIHRSVLDPRWTPDRERQRSLVAFALYATGPFVLLGGLAVQQPLIGAGVAAASLVAAFLLRRNPLQAFRMAFLDVRCSRHAQTAPMRCPACHEDLCHECILPSVRCPDCGVVVSKAVTHLIADGQWMEAGP